MASHKILVKNVRPVRFPGIGSEEPVDLLVENGKLAAIRNVDTAGAEEADFGGAYISPAWVDMHTHVYWGGSDIAVWPHEIGIVAGAPILVDAGSAGEGNFPGFRKFLIEPAREWIIPFLNVGSVGLVAANRVPEVRALSDIDIERIIETVTKNKDIIKGLKVRMCSIIHSETDILPLKLAKKLSRVLKLPLMVHIGRSLPLVEEVLDRLDSGDILTHCCHGKAASSVVDDAPAFAAALRAQRRGVVMDIGHGSASFSYKVGRECFDRGLFPDTLGSDLHTGNINGPVWDLSIVMSKMLAIGMSFEQVVDAVTVAPRRALGLPEPVFAKDADAAFTIFGLEKADMRLPDSLGDVLAVTERIVPKAVLWKGELTRAASRYDKAVDQS